MVILKGGYIRGGRGLYFLRRGLILVEVIKENGFVLLENFRDFHIFIKRDFHSLLHDRPVLICFCFGNRIDIFRYASHPTETNPKRALH